MKIYIKYCKSKKYIFLFGLLVIQMVLFSQENEGKSNIPVIDSVMAFSPAYMPVDFAFTDPLFLIPLKYKPVDTMLIDAHHFDPLFSTENLYQSLGISGQAHQTIPFDFEREVGFTYLQLPYPLYFKKQKACVLMYFRAHTLLFSLLLFFCFFFSF